MYYKLVKCNFLESRQDWGAFICRVGAFSKHFSWRQQIMSSYLISSKRKKRNRTLATTQRCGCVVTVSSELASYISSSILTHKTHSVVMLKKKIIPELKNKLFLKETWAKIFSFSFQYKILLQLAKLHSSEFKVDCMKEIVSLILYLNKKRKRNFSRDSVFYSSIHNIFDAFTN